MARLIGDLPLGSLIKLDKDSVDSALWTLGNIGDKVQLFRNKITGSTQYNSVEDNSILTPMRQNLMNWVETNISSKLKSIGTFNIPSRTELSSGWFTNDSRRSIGEYYWTRSPYSSSNNYNGWVVYSDGRLSYQYVTQSYGLRPMLTINTNVCVYGTPDSNGVYTLMLEDDNKKRWMLNYSGGVQEWTVPAGIKKVLLEVWGAQGGSYNNDKGVGGLGGYSKGLLEVTEGETLYVYVGEQPTGRYGGWNGGGMGGSHGDMTSFKPTAGGGGATDIRRGGTSLENRIIVAGGGGGNGFSLGDGQNGAGGGLKGNDAKSSSLGSGGTQTSGGVGALNGTLGKGGQGRTAPVDNSSGNDGGGGGYYGGAGANGSGGGGSGYIGGVLQGTTSVGINRGHGKVIITEANTIPSIMDNTSNNKIFYEGDTLTLNGSVIDSDNGNIMSVKYKINNGTTRAIATGISDGATPLNYSKILKYTLGTLKDGDTVIASGLVDGQQYKITIWAEDDQGGKSEEVVRNFTVVPNRAPVLNIDPITPQTNKINSEKITISGTVTDADGNDVTVDVKINNNASVQIYSGVPSDFSHDIKIADLKEGENTITVTSKDTFDFVTTKVIKLNKARNAVPLKKAIARYKVNPPTGSAKQILAWIQKEVGYLTIDADVSMVLQGESEQYVAMNKLTSPINDLLEEDEFTYKATEEKDNITLKLKLSKESTESKQSIKQISGVLG